LIGLAEAELPGDIKYTRRANLRAMRLGIDIRTDSPGAIQRSFACRCLRRQCRARASVVEGPYVAGNAAVSIENDYVVVDL